MQYFDMETEDLVDESSVREKYEWFKRQPWFSGDYETFVAKHFQKLEERADAGPER